jgi:transmembrane sensor
MQDKVNDILLRYSQGKYSYNDYLKIKKWFEDEGSSDDLKRKLLLNWKDLNKGEVPTTNQLNHIFEKVQYEILLEEKNKSKKRTLWQVFRQVAAILFIPVLMFSVWYNMSPRFDNTQEIVQAEQIVPGWIEINAPDGARVQFLLPDSTMGWLNSGAKLKYQSDFSQQRKVDLIGEAYFEVKHRNKADFIVSVNDMDVKVLGTTFNVTAYPEDETTDVVLKEGKVEIDGKTGVFNYTLVPNEKITFNQKTRELNVQKVNADSYMAWKDGLLVINNESLGQVVDRIERWYNAEIIIQDEKLKNYKFKATFKDEPLEEVLRLMAMTTPITYKIEKRTLGSNGILKRKKIIIKSK